MPLDPQEAPRRRLQEAVAHAGHLLQALLHQGGALQGARLESLILLLEEGLAASRSLDGETSCLLRDLLRPLWQASHSLREIEGEGVERLCERVHRLREAVGLAPLEAPPPPPPPPPPSWSSTEER